MSLILTVDNMKINNDLIIDCLDRTGHEIAAVESGAAALDYIRDREVDLFILDVSMPQMDGIALSKHIRADDTHGNKPIILMTALYSGNKNAMMEEAQATAFINKPFRAKHLLDTVAELLSAPANA